MIVTCEHCGMGIRDDDRGTWQYTQGWCQHNRPHGGTNAVALPERLRRYACASCISLLRKGIAIEQQALF